MALGSNIQMARSRAVGGKRDRCLKGKSCSATCISSWKQCLVEMSGTVSSFVGRLRGNLGEGTGRRGLGQSLDGENIDTKKLDRRVDAWRKENGLQAVRNLKNVAGHDETHVLVSDYFGRSTRQIAKLMGGLGRGPSVLEEAFVNVVETLLDKSPKERKAFLTSDLAKSLLKRHFTTLNSLYPSPENKRLVENSDRVINSFLRVFSKLESRKDFDTFLKTVKVAREYSNRQTDRFIRYEGVKDKLYNEMFEAAKSGDRRRYRDAEGRLLTLIEKAGPRFYDKDTVERNSIWDMYSSTLPHKLGASLAKPGSGIKMEVGGETASLTTIIGGQNLTVKVSPSSLMFTVNGSTSVSRDIPMSTRLQIIKELRKQFNVITSNMEEGSVVKVSAADADGYGKNRERAYVGSGFSNPDKKGDMYGRVVEGKMVPSSLEDYLKRNPAG